MQSYLTKMQRKGMAGLVGKCMALDANTQRNALIEKSRICIFTDYNGRFPFE